MAQGKGILAKNISFKGCKETMEDVFGKKPIARPDVMRIVSAYIRDQNLVKK